MSSNQDLKNKTKKGLYWSFFNQFSNYGLNFCIGIVMARLLTPEDYGITALPAVFIAVATILQSAGIGDALVRKQNLTEEDMSTCFYYSIGVGIVMYSVLFFSAPWIADFYNTPVLAPLMRVTALTFLWGPIGAIQTIHLRRRLDFKTPTKIGLVSRIISASIGIALAFMGYGLWSLVASGVISSLLAIILQWWAVRWVPTTGWNKESFKYLWGYGNKIMGSYFLGTLYENIMPIFVAKYFSPTQLGIYNRAQGYAALPSQNVSGMIQNVTFPVLAKLQDDNDALRRNYRRMLTTTAFIVFPLMMALSALARPLVITMVTEKWEECILLLQIICFSMMWYPIHSMNLNLLQVKGRSDLFFRLEVIKKIVGLSIIAFTLPQGLVVFCCGQVVSSLISLFINTYYTGKLIDLGYFKQMRDLAPILALSFAMFGTLHFCNTLFDNYLLQIFIGGTIGALVYLAGAIIFKFPQLEDVKYMLKTKK